MTLGQPYFDDLYRHHPDPWGFRTRWYETRKRQMTMAALPDQHYASVFEPGCSIGLLTRLLAARSDRVLAMDICRGRPPAGPGRSTPPCPTSAGVRAGRLAVRPLRPRRALRAGLLPR